MKITSGILITGILLLFVSFNKVSEFKLERKILGKWSFFSEMNEKGAWKKVEKLDPNKSGMEFKKDGILIVQMNSGSCATPPISYDNYDGIWKKTSDSTLVISHGFWGGKLESNILIKTLNNKKLVFEILNDKIIKN
ncbi:hypothetical protein [uncultured Aquimarina sp.]|uniref:hypothetical protein n=1 Tax=uncultured Aquimarina sp. TaxID=575652 RepID=UPI00261A88EE|nr:hypothetical protein [uncultured Aquimarina sp.]